VPGLTSEHRDARGRIKAKAVLRVPGVYRDLTPEQRAAWNKASTAALELIEVFTEVPRTDLQ
jgi:hypothetical protein